RLHQPLQAHRLQQHQRQTQRLQRQHLRALRQRKPHQPRQQAHQRRLRAVSIAIYWHEIEHDGTTKSGLIRTF
ncbi:unnamed protein product, partial [Rotaria sp. Silwood2]